MVECVADLNLIFQSLADPVRRDILRRSAKEELCVSELAEPYRMTLAAISKHLRVLEKAKLIVKRREGKRQFVTLAPVAFQEASTYLREYEKLWNTRLDALESYLSTFPQ